MNIFYMCILYLKYFDEICTISQRTFETLVKVKTILLRVSNVEGVVFALPYIVLSSSYREE